MAVNANLSDDTIAKLSKASVFLRTVPPEVFMIDDWEFESARAPFTVPGECGFAGCAVGWFIHAKLFNGLVWKSRFNARPVYKDCTDYQAAAAIFDISNLTAEYFFSPSAYDKLADVTPTMVADRIDEYIKSPISEEAYLKLESKRLAELF